MFNKPADRFGTVKAIKELASELRLPYTSDMQDWSYEVADPKQIKSYVSHYSLQTDNDKKFVLMEMIVQATEDQDDNILMDRCWQRVSQLLIEDFKLHQYTVYYWSCFDSEDLSDCWKVSSYMRDLWYQMTIENL